MATWLITGATGFVGRHVLDVLQAELREQGRADDSVLVLGRRCPENWPASRFVRADLDDSEGLRQADPRPRARPRDPHGGAHSTRARRIAVPGELLGDDPPAQRAAGPEPAGPSHPGGLGRGARAGAAGATCRSPRLIRAVRSTPTAGASGWPRSPAWPSGRRWR